MGRGGPGSLELMIQDVLSAQAPCKCPRNGPQIPSSCCPLHPQFHSKNESIKRQVQKHTADASTTRSGSSSPRLAQDRTVRSPGPGLSKPPPAPSLHPSASLPWTTPLHPPFPLQCLAGGEVPRQRWKRNALDPALPEALFYTPAAGVPSSITATVQPCLDSSVLWPGPKNRCQMLRWVVHSDPLPNPPSSPLSVPQEPDFQGLCPLALC